jgi:rhodanese-related sulfurtransferase
MKQLAVQDLAAHCAADPSILLLDVREAWEVERAALALPGVEVRNIPLMRIPDEVDRLDPAQPIVCLCHHGMRSLQVVAFLERQCFESVYNLAGGIDAWSLQVDPRVPRY